MTRKEIIQALKDVKWDGLQVMPPDMAWCWAIDTSVTGKTAYKLVDFSGNGEQDITLKDVQ